MNYVTIKNGVVTPIERKQLYAHLFIIKNRITALDWEGNVNTNETTINNSIIKDNIPTNSDKIHLIMNIASSSSRVYRVAAAMYRQFNRVGNIYPTRGIYLSLEDDSDTSTHLNYKLKVTLFCAKTQYDTNSKDINISTDIEVRVYDDCIVDIELSNTNIKLNGKIIYTGAECEIAKQGFYDKNVEVMIGNLCRCKKVFLEYLNYE